jgi:predicted nucleotide-binding protein
LRALENSLSTLQSSNWATVTPLLPNQERVHQDRRWEGKEAILNALAREERCSRRAESQFIAEYRMSQPSLFVGSSGEGIEVARAIQVQLADDCEVELWNEGVFALGYGTLESLVQALNRFDFGLFVLTGDDLTVSKGVEQKSARDNVLIEFGLFVGRLGRERTFLLCCKDDHIKIPSDLAGMTFATFSMPADLTKLIPAVGPACVKIRNAVRALGKAAQLKEMAEELQTQGERVQDHERKLLEQQEYLNQMVKYSMSASIFHHLCGVALLKEYIYHDGDATRREMYYLRDHGFIKPKLEAFLDFDHKLDGRNLVEMAEPTPVGWHCVRLRKDEIPRNMLEDGRNLSVDPSTL